MLILAATPIGNLSDASPRLVEHLQSSHYIAAEDTRTLYKLAQALGIQIHAKTFSLHDHNEHERIEQLVEIARDHDLLVVSDAGMPTVSDPGFNLVRACAEHDIVVTVIPGPSAVLSALAVSGLPTDRFTFEGFLPRKDGERKTLFEELLREQRTMIFFESPHRIHESLKVAAEIFGKDRKASVSRELTKKFEHTERGSLGQLIQWAAEEPKGEMVVVIAGAAAELRDISTLVQDVLDLAETGVGLKQAVAEIAEITKVSKSELYQLALDARKLNG
ncbi:MAG: 16S rRNA (cytidine(1402)-2'-O)-methyltransferase [Micrococcales bacterium]